jgi:hypothetical protein
MRIQLFEKAVHIDGSKSACKGQMILGRNILSADRNDRMIDKGLINRLKLLIVFDVGSDDFCTKATCKGANIYHNTPRHCVGMSLFQPLLRVTIYSVAPLISTIR